MPRPPLTPRQNEVLQFVRRFKKNRRRPPSLTELADHLGLADRRQTAEDHLRALALLGHAREACTVVPSLRADLPTCRHCGRVARAAGLCWGCRRVPEVRRLYTQPTGLFAGAGVPPPATEATDARPGSEEKLNVMAARAAAGRQVFHPGDPVVRVESHLRHRRGRGEVRSGAGRGASHGAA